MPRMTDGKPSESNKKSPHNGICPSCGGEIALNVLSVWKCQKCNTKYKKVNSKD